MNTYLALMPDSEFERIIQPSCIGSGRARSVYGVEGDQAVVIKKMDLPCAAANFFEWFIWNAVKTTKWGNVFGRCIAISESGRYLMMERLDDIQETEYRQTPTVPKWLQDVKPSNFGKNLRPSYTHLRQYSQRAGKAPACGH